MQILQFFRELKLTILDLISTLQEMRNNLKEMRKTIDGMWIKTTSGTNITFTDYAVHWGYDLSINDFWLDKCYFTKEVLNKEATNTKTLFVIENDAIKKRYFKEWNQTKEVKEIGGKYYLFK